MNTIPNDAAPVLMILSGFSCVLAISLLVCYIMYQVSLMKAVAECSPRNQAIQPGLVWLNMIPLFNLFWLYWTAIKVGDSLASEFRSRG